MNIEHSSKNAIRHNNQLTEQFLQLVTTDPDLHWTLPDTSRHQPLPWLELELDGKHHRFTPLFNLKPSLPWLEKLQAAGNTEEPSSVLREDAPHDGRGHGSGTLPPLLVTPELTARVRDFCRAQGIAAIDLNGRAWLRAPGLLVDRGPLPGRKFRTELEPRNIFTGKSARIVRCLLTDRDRRWTQAEIVPRTGASAGLVSRIVQHLVSQGFVEQLSAREFKVRDPLGLVDAWAAEDRPNRRLETHRLSSFGQTPVELARRLHAFYGNLLRGIPKTPSSLEAAIEAAQPSFTRSPARGSSIAFTQWIAGWLRHPHAEPVVTSAYVGFLPTSGQLEALGLRPVTEAGNVWLHFPDDEGVFLETQIVQGLPLASDAQIYLDLQKTGLRGPEQAAALREWEGFCRP